MVIKGGQLRPMSGCCYRNNAILGSHLFHLKIHKEGPLRQRAVREQVHTEQTVLQNLYPRYLMTLTPDKISSLNCTRKQTDRQSRSSVRAGEMSELPDLINNLAALFFIRVEVSEQSFKGSST